MIVRRRWIDAEGRPQIEEVVLMRALPGAAVADLSGPGPTEVEGGAPDVPMTVVGISNPVAGTVPDPSLVLSAPIPDGVRIVDVAEWDAARHALDAAREASTADALSAGADPQRAAVIAALAEAAGLDPDAVAAVLDGGA